MTDLWRRVQEEPVTIAGRFFYYFLPWRRALVHSNIATAFGTELSKKQQHRLALAFYSHIARSMKEMLHMRFLSQKVLQSRVEIRGHEKLLAVAAEGKGILILTGHFGNWEFAPIGGILNFQEFQGMFHFIRRTLSVKWLEKLLFRRYYQAGLHVIPKKNSLQQVCDALQQNHAVVFVLDQHASLVNRDGIAAEFFGKKAGTYRSLASLARHTGVPVIPARAYRRGDGRHVLEFLDPLSFIEADSSQEELYRNSLQYNQSLEQIIRAHPAQWLWLHKRWKLPL